MRSISGDPISLSYTDLCKHISLGTRKLVLYHEFQRSAERNATSAAYFWVLSGQPVKMFPFCTYLNVNVLKWITFPELRSFNSRAAQEGIDGGVREILLKTGREEGRMHIYKE